MDGALLFGDCAGGGLETERTRSQAANYFRLGRLCSVADSPSRHPAVGDFHGPHNRERTVSARVGRNYGLGPVFGLASHSNECKAAPDLAESARD